MLLLIPLLLTLSILEISTKPDYYWRRYYGQVPFDAVVAARTDQNTIYIGRAAFEERGVLVGPIIQCSKNVTVTSWSRVNAKMVHSLDKFSEILCSPLPHTHFKWVSVTIETVLNQTGLVEGGFESLEKGVQNGVLYIGRLKDDKQTVKIGKVAGYYYRDQTYTNRFFYADGQSKKSKNSFEVLVYEDRNATSDKMCPSSLGNIWRADYYWRRFDGEIPYDAVSFSNGTFIGRAPFERKGFLVGPIYRGFRKVTVTMSSDVNTKTAHYLDQFVEILCSPYTNRFAWVQTSSESLLSRTELVEGGFEFCNDKIHDGVLYIGSIMQGERIKMGKVIGYFKDDVMKNKFYYDQNGNEESSKNYRVLTYHYPKEA